MWFISVSCILFLVDWADLETHEKKVDFNKITLSVYWFTMVPRMHTLCVISRSNANGHFPYQGYVNYYIAC